MPPPILSMNANTTIVQMKQGITALPVTKPRRSEAELVKAFRGEPLELSTPKPNGGEGEEGDIQPVRDVVLQRAVDILKGIRVLLSWR